VEVVFVDKSEEAKKTKVPDNKATQIVEQSEKQINKEVDEKAKYLSRFNQKVVRETKAAHSGKFQNESHQGPAPKAEQNQMTQNAQPQQTPTAQKLLNPKSQKPSSTSESGLPKLANLMPKFEWNKARSGVENPGPVSQTDDHLKDVQTGAETILSSREFVYYAYYSRIKDRLRLYWEPKIKEKMNRIFASGRKIASEEDRITKLVIVLDQAGKLIKVQVLSESGLKDLDDAAIEAFQAAAPFPNPPKGIIESDGTIKIRWDFVIEAQNDLFKLPRKNSYAFGR
jgi:protein TonB